MYHQYNLAMIKFYESRIEWLTDIIMNSTRGSINNSNINNYIRSLNKAYIKLNRYKLRAKFDRDIYNKYYE